MRGGKKKLFDQESNGRKYGGIKVREQKSSSTILCKKRGREREKGEEKKNFEDFP